MKRRLELAAYTLGWALVRAAPEWLPRWFFRLVADVLWWRRPRGVRRLEANLRRVLASSGRPVEEAALRMLSRAGMRSYLRYWREVFRLPTTSAQTIVGGMRVRDEHYLRDAVASGRGVVLALPHMGNWDHAGAWLTATGVPFTTVAERLQPEELFDRFVAFRESLGMEVLPLTGGERSPYAVLRERLRSGGCICLLADRDLTSSGIDVAFFGDTARMPAGPAALALATGAVLLPVTLTYPALPHPALPHPALTPSDAPAHGDVPAHAGACSDPAHGVRWRGRVHPPVEAPAEGSRPAKVAVMTQQLADAFAEAIAEAPQDWHMLQRLWLSDLDPASVPPVRAPVRVDTAAGGARG